MTGWIRGRDEGLGLGLSPGRFMNHSSLLLHIAWLPALGCLSLAFSPRGLQDGHTHCLQQGV